MHTASGGEQGLALAAAHRPDAIVLDIRMPDVNGLTVLSRLKEDKQLGCIPVIMCSASLVDQRDALDRGASSFVEKPFEAAKIIEAIDVALARSGKPQMI